MYVVGWVACHWFILEESHVLQGSPYHGPVTTYQSHVLEIRVVNFLD